MTSLSFYGGISTIGGNCVIIEEDGIRIMLDNGMCFSKEGEYYKDFLKPRTNNDLRDYLRLGLIPEIPGIYGEEKICDICLEDADSKSKYLFTTDLLSYEDYVEENGVPYIHAVFLSHAHLDHIRNILFMAPEIPIYCSEISEKLLAIISDLSDDKFLQYSYHVREKRSSGYFPGSIYKKKKYRERKINIINPNDIIEIPEKRGIFKIKGYPVDHSLPGAMAFEVITRSGKKILYTGDIRFHGHGHEKSNSINFLNNATHNPDILITEGTRIDDDTLISEEDVYKNITTLLRKDSNVSNKLIMVKFPWKSISRFLTVYKLARELKRVIVIQPKLAYIIHHLQNFDNLPIKGILKEEDVRIYLPRKYSMIYSNDDYKNTKFQISFNVNWSEDHHSTFYSTKYGDNVFIRACDINKKPRDYILHLTYYDLNELIDICPPKDSYFFNLKTEPFDEEGELEEKILMNWMDKFGLKFQKGIYHASGHASATDIKDMIRKFNPLKIFPIHTEKPELFDFKNVERDIIKGQKYEI